MKINSCPVSGDKSTERTYAPFTIDGVVYEIIRCTSCNHHYTLFHSEVDVDKYYDEMDYTIKDNRKTIFHKIQQIEYNKVLRVISKLTDERELMDFGSGKGVFLSFAKDKGYNVVGVETSKPRADYAKRTFDVAVSTEYYSEGRIFDRRFPVITMFHVLEHIPKIPIFLKNLYSGNLSPEGVAVIEVPNFGSLQSKWAKERWLQIDIPRHVSHFTEKSLEGLIAQLNFEIVRKETFSLHLGVIGMVQTIMSYVGYKGFLLGDLKNKKTATLLVKVALVFPIAFALEWICSLIGRGGVLRYYLKQKK